MPTEVWTRYSSNDEIEEKKENVVFPDETAKPVRMTDEEWFRKNGEDIV